MSDSELTMVLARWFEARLHETVGFALPVCRLYGLEVIDPSGVARGDHGAARVSFVVEGSNRDLVLRNPEARRVLGFDAAALVSIEWRPAPSAVCRRPGEYTGRQRARVVELALGDHHVTVVRFENDPDFVVLAPAS